MKDIIVKVTNFVNENTMLLIGICAFLILALIVYLIDNSVKTKKMEKALKEMDETEDKVVSSNIEEDNTPKDAAIEFDIKPEVKEDEPKFDSISLVDEENELSDETEVKPEDTVPSFADIMEEKVQEPIPSEEVKTEESKFTNKKSLSEILSKKESNDNLDLNNTDKTLEETTEFNNTF